MNKYMRNLFKFDVPEEFQDVVDLTPKKKVFTRVTVVKIVIVVALLLLALYELQ